MMNEASDQAYCLERAAAARRSAALAIDERVARIHREMAERYEDMARLAAMPAPVIRHALG